MADFREIGYADSVHSGRWLVVLLVAIGCGRVSFSVQMSTDGGADALGANIDAAPRDSAFANEGRPPGADSGGSIDSGRVDAVDGCLLEAEICNGVDDDCDDRIDENTDAQCRAQNADGRCVAGSCDLACLAGFGDCDRIVANGCEQSLSADGHCGACDNRCATNNAIARCNGSVGCVISSCNGTFLDCDSEYANGCESVAVMVWPDNDDDGFGNSAPPQLACLGTGAGNSDDCDDANPTVNPGQTLFFEEPNGSGFDWNCDQIAEREFNELSTCAASGGPLCPFVIGWFSEAVPGCGAGGTLLVGCEWDGAICQPQVEIRVQACR